MAGKAVSFASELGVPAETSFTTWPKCAIKQTGLQRSGSLPSSPTAVSTKSTEALVEDVYFRVSKLKEADVPRCLEYIIDGHCKNVLVAYSVLNTVLRGTSISDQDEDLGFNGIAANYHIESSKAEALLSRACSDLDTYSRSADVLDSRVLQQLMRSVETLWTRDCIPKPEMSSMLGLLAEGCVSLVESRPGSKLLLSPAVRVVNLALEESAIEPVTAKRLLFALARTHFVFAASFTAELIVVLTTMQRVQPSILRENARVWVPLAVRALVSSSSLTRNLALHLLVSSDSRNQPHIANALLDPSDPQRQDSEPLEKIIMRRFPALLNGSQEDVKVVAESWCLVLESAAQNPGPWPLMERWIELEHLIFRVVQKSMPVIWSSVIFAQNADPSYCKLLLPPFSVLRSVDDAPLSKMFAEAIASVDCKHQHVWDQALYPLLKCLAPKIGPEVLQSWAELAHTFEFTENNISAYLEIFAMVFRGVSSQNIPRCETLWTCVVRCCANSRPKAMELVRFHYRLLLEDSSIVPLTLSLQLTDILIKIWPLSFSSEKPKTSSFSLLTLILLPVVTSIPADRQGEYLDKLLANCKSEEALRVMLSALLCTARTDSENQFNKWAIAAMTLRVYIGSSNDPLSAALCVDALTMFFHIAIKQSQEPSAGHWAEWQKLFIAGSIGREKVLAQIPHTSAQGLRFMLTIPGFESEICRIFSASMLHSKETPSASNPIIVMLKQKNLAPSLLDNLVRSLIARKSVDAVKWALALIPSSRMFVIAKPMLTVIEQADSSELVELWNLKVAPSLERSPAFVPKDIYERLASAKPALIIPASVIISPVGALTNLTSTKAQFSSTPLKRQMPETPPPSSKRSRRTILTGSVPPSLSTPPTSSDPIEESSNSSASSEDLLCSSPPQRSRAISGASQGRESWRNSQQERARTLKKVMMGLNMEEAVNDMKRSEMVMIYNLLFRSCVKLKTHLAAVAPALPAAEINAAVNELRLAKQKQLSLKAAEETMFENSRRRALSSDPQELFSDVDSDYADEEAEEDEEVCDAYAPPNTIKLELQ